MTKKNENEKNENDRRRRIENKRKTDDLKDIDCIHTHTHIQTNKRANGTLNAIEVKMKAYTRIYIHKK